MALQIWIMKIYAPLFIVLRLVVYGALFMGMAQGIFFDASNPVEGRYFSEISFTEIAQESIVFILFLFYTLLGTKWKAIQPVSNLVGMFFLMIFIREFDFLMDFWFYLVLGVIAFSVGLFVRDFRKIKQSCIEFFRTPPSQWFLSGLMITLVFSRLMGRTIFWRLMYHDETYRLAKSATEEGIELLGYTIMLVSALEFFAYYWAVQKRSQQSAA